MVKKIERAASSRRVKELINIAQRMGLAELEVGDIKLKFDPRAFQVVGVDKAAVPVETKSERIPTDEELLNWSSPHFDYQTPEAP